MPFELKTLLPKMMGWRPTGDIGPYTMYTMRNGTVVFYEKAPPKEPASYRQLILRNRWRTAAASWGNMGSDQKALWHLAAKQARLYFHGYALWVFWSTTQDRPTLKTIERQSGVQLLPD